MNEQAQKRSLVFGALAVVLVAQFCIAVATYSFTIRFFEFHDRHSQAALRDAITNETENQIANMLNELREIARDQKAMLALMRGTPQARNNNHQPDDKGNDPFDDVVETTTDVNDFDVIREMTQAELNQLDQRIRDDRVRRFEESLDEKGLEELQTRIETRLDQMRTGTVPGFEGIGVGLKIPQEGPYAERFHSGVRESVLTEMYMQQQFEKDMMMR